MFGIGPRSRQNWGVAMRSAIRFVFLAAMVALAGPAWATDSIPGSTLHYGNWDGSAFADDNGFTHCAISAPYQSGITLHFAIDRKYLWRMGFSHPNWTMRAGDSFGIVYQIDGYRSVSAEATVIDPTFAMAELIATERLFNQFRRGNTLRVRSGGETYSFSLRGTSKALAIALQCVNRWIDYRPYRAPEQPAPPVASNEPAPSGSASDDDGSAPPLFATSPQDMLAATRFAVSLFSSSEFSGYKLMTENEMTRDGTPEFIRSAAVGWSSPEAIGTLHVIAPDALDPTDAIAEVMSGDSKNCKGSFASGKKTVADGTPVITAFAACKEGGKYTFYNDYIAFRRPDRKVYLISSMQSGKADVDRNVSEALARNVAIAITE